MKVYKIRNSSYNSSSKEGGRENRKFNVSQKALKVLQQMENSKHMTSH